jgi:hypothetical protein
VRDAWSFQKWGGTLAAAACIGIALVLFGIVSNGDAEKRRHRVSPASAIDSTWRPNYRIGPIRFNYPLSDSVTVLSRGARGRFAIRAQPSGAVIRGYVFPDPNTGRDGARTIWTESKLLNYRGVRVGVNWRTARRRLGQGFELHRGRGCSWLNTSGIRRDRTGPASTQLFFRPRTGQIFRIALDEITEIGCPR